jgi:hypothetical protein
MVRETEPQLTVPEDATAQQRKILAGFIAVVNTDPTTADATVRAYNELSKTKSHKGMSSTQRLALSAVGRVLNSKADLEATPDPETAEAMRRAIADIDPEDFDGRRLARLGAFTMGVLLWKEQQPSQLPEVQEQQNASSAA